MTTALGLDRISTPLGPPIGLPGELGTKARPLGAAVVTGEAGVPGPAPAAAGGAPAPRKRFRRKGLLVTVALFTAVMAAGAGAGWVYSHEIVAFDRRHVVLLAYLQHRMASAAKLPAEVGIQPDATPVTPARRPEADPAPAAPRPQAVEFAALQSFPDSAPAEVGVSAPSPSTAVSTRDPMPASPAPTPAPPTPPFAAAAPPVSSPGPVAGAMAAVDAVPTPIPVLVEPSPPASAAPSTLAPQPPTPSPVSAPLPAAVPAPAAVTALSVRDPVVMTAELRAAPMAAPEQVKVIDLLKELGAQLRDTRTEVAQLRTTVAQLVDTVETRTTEFETRLGLAEAGTVLAQSARAGQPEPPAAAQPIPPGLRLASAGRAVPQPVPATAASTPLVPAQRTVKDYKLQGASPGLAVLSVLNPTPGGQSVLEVATGSDVPGVGRIKAIFQRGTVWVVQTDAGVIQ